MKTLVIYDTTGRIWSIIYGGEEAPQGLQCMWVDIPEGAVLERIDVTDAGNPQPIYSYLPESDIGRLQKKAAALEDELKDVRGKIADLDMYNAELTIAMADMIGGEANAE